MTATPPWPGMPTPETLVGTWRRFGLTGPVYEIVRLAKPRESGEPLLRVRVLETGEELDYSFAEILCDPSEL